MVTSTSGLSGEKESALQIGGGSSTKTPAEVWLMLSPKNSRWKTNHTQIRRKTNSNKVQIRTIAKQKSKRIAQHNQVEKTILVRSGGEHVFTLQDLKPESAKLEWILLWIETTLLALHLLTSIQYFWEYFPILGFNMSKSDMEIIAFLAVTFTEFRALLCRSNDTSVSYDNIS
ncbi:hypothetical protein CEXT_712701 [Caerostris extrusa]|uniref:Uncharacterized protein n=1 Tax=Caerostris extrusa TaxID=172846 RepID=A0AAV4XTU6_CAEEX|nr:hypothetical protein CEXT_712701 [Caerostris extrusa]